MSTFLAMPTIPPWDSIHPVIIHFPVALLLVAPLFLIVGAVLKPETGRPYLVAALILMCLGTIGTWVAVATGEATGELVERNPEISAAIERHEELAETTRMLFTGLTIVFAIVVAAPLVMKRMSSRSFSTILPLVFLAFYGAAALLLANTAHQGGRLVHELGSSPPMGSSETVPSASTGEAGAQD